MELQPGVHQLIHGKEPFAGFPPPNVFLLSGTKASILLDTGWDDENDHEARMDYIRNIKGPPLAGLILMHQHLDHAGGALRLHRATGVPMSCHPMDRERIEKVRFKGEAEVQNLLYGGERIDLGGLTLEVFHAPGHTMGSLAILLPERRALFTTDTVLGVTSTVIRPEDGDLAKYAATLEMLRDLEADVIYPGHGPLVEDASRRIDVLIRHRQYREEQLIAAVGKGISRVPDLRRALYGEQSPKIEELTILQIRTGLRKLVEEGMVILAEGEYTLV
jgi:ribonuclease/clavin/mitogillin